LFKSKIGPVGLIRSKVTFSTKSWKLNTSRPSGIDQPISARKLSSTSGR